MRIALVHSFYRSDYPSGENISVSLQAEALSAAGHDVRIFSRHSDDYVGKPFYQLTAGVSVATGQGPSPLAEIHQFGPDVIHVHNLFPNWGTSWLKKVDVPIVATVHNFRPVCSAGTLLRAGKFCDLCPTQGSHHAIRHACYQQSAVKTLPLAVASRKSQTPEVFAQADALIFLSERTRTMYESYGLGFPEKAHVIPNFVQATKAPPNLSGTERKVAWMFAGRLSTEKGILDLIRHWPEDIPLDVIGGGPEEQKCWDAAANKKIIFHGQKSREFVGDLLQQARGLVFPSTCVENSPLIYLEALSAGLPVVALAGNSVSDDVVLGETGLVVEAASGFPAGAKRVEEGYDMFRKNALVRYETVYSQPVWTHRIVSLYESLVEFI